MATYQPLPANAAAPAAAAPTRFPRLAALKESIKSIVCDQPATFQAQYRQADYPLRGGYTAPLALELITFPELDEACPQDEILRTIAGINAILRAEGPRYHLPIYVGTTVLLVAGGVVVGVIAAVAAGIYFTVRKNRATRAVESFLRAENDKSCYAKAGIRWHMGPRGVQMEYTSWELVETPAVAAAPAYTPAPVPQMYPAVPIPQQQPAVYYAPPTVSIPAAVASAVATPMTPQPAAAPIAPAPVQTGSAVPQGMTYEQQVAWAVAQSQASQKYYRSTQ